MNALVDTGTEHTYISAHVAEKADILVDKQINLTVITATAQKSIVVGHAIACFEFNNRRQKLDIKVAKVMSSPLLLGMDFMRSIGLIIDTGVNDVLYRDGKSDKLLTAEGISMAFEFKKRTTNNKEKVEPKEERLIGDRVKSGSHVDTDYPSSDS